MPRLPANHALLIAHGALAVQSALSALTQSTNPILKVNVNWLYAWVALIGIKRLAHVNCVLLGAKNALLKLQTAPRVPPLHSSASWWKWYPTVRHLKQLFPTLARLATHLAKHAEMDSLVILALTLTIKVWLKSTAIPVLKLVLSA
jgi:hypothetical protein